MRTLVMMSIVLSVVACKKEPVADSTGKNGVMTPMKAMKSPGTLTPATPPKKPAPKPTVVASPTTLTVLNDTARPVVLDLTFGEISPFGIVARSGNPEPSLQFGPCACRCGGPCIEGAKPPYRQVELAPGKSHKVAWDGLLTLYKNGRPPYSWCCTQLAPPAGKYTVSVCTKDQRCARTEVTLPAKAPVLIRMSTVATADSCAAVDLSLGGHQARQFAATRVEASHKGATAKCTGKPVCVAPTALDAALAKARKASCSLFLVPRGQHVEVRAFLPLKGGPTKGESFSAFYDPSFTRLFRVDLSR